MFEILREEKWITIAMLLFFGISILMRIFLGLLLENMIKETDNMVITKNKLLKQCKLKFANCYQLNKGVANIPIFVDKFISRLSFGSLSFVGMYHLSGQAMLLSVVCAGIGICKSIVMGKMLGEILPFYIVSFIGLYVYFSVSAIVDIKGKKRILKVNLVDYLENHLSSQINTTQDDLELLYGESTYREQRMGLRKNTGRRSVELLPIGGKITIAGEEKRDLEPQVNAQTSSLLTEEELESLLQEFLTI